MATFNEQLLKIVEDYRASGAPWPATKVQMAEWAVANDRYHFTRGMAVSQCAEKIARAMGLEHVKDKKGRSVRKYYAAAIRENGQLVMKWDDLNAERPFMEVAAANRRNQVLGQCWQITSVRLKREQIQLVALDIVVGFVFDSGNYLIERHFFEERH